MSISIRSSGFAIPYAEVRTYGDLAHAVGGMARAVVGAAGLTGYSGGSGVDTKKALLDLERGQKSLPL